MRFSPAGALGRSVSLDPRPSDRRSVPAEVSARDCSTTDSRHPDLTAHCRFGTNRVIDEFRSYTSGPGRRRSQVAET